MNRKLVAIKKLLLLIFAIQLLSFSNLISTVVGTNELEFKEISTTNLSFPLFSHTPSNITQSGISRLSPNTVELGFLNSSTLKVDQYTNPIILNNVSNSNPAFTHDVLKSSSEDFHSRDEQVRFTLFQDATELNSPAESEEHSSLVNFSDLLESSPLQQTSLMSNYTFSALPSSVPGDIFLEPSLSFQKEYDEFDGTVFSDHDIFFTEIPKHVVIPYTGQENTTIELSWTATDVGGGSMAFGTRTYEVVLYDPSNFLPGHSPLYPEDYTSLDHSQLHVSDSGNGILEQLDRTTGISLITNSFSPAANTWEPDERLTLSYTHTHFPYASIVMGFYYDYLTIGLQYGFILTPVPQYKAQYTSTRVYFADDESPKFLDFPKNNDTVYSNNDLNRNCPDEYPTVSQALREKHGLVNQSQPPDISSPDIIPPDNSVQDCGRKLTISYVDDLSVHYERGAPNPVLQYTVFDYKPYLYQIFAQPVNPTKPSSIARDLIAWDSEVPVSYTLEDMYLTQDHVFTAIFHDQQFNFVSQVVYVKIVDPTPPEFSSMPSTLRDVEDARLVGTLHPGDAFVQSDISAIIERNDFLAIEDEYEIIVYEPDFIQNHLLKWEILEFSPTNYTVYKDGTIIPGYENRTYSDRAPPTVLLTEVGELLLNEAHNFTIVIRDIFGYSISDTLFVVLTDRTKPTITGEYLLNISDDLDSEHELEWIAEDFYPDKFTLYLELNPIPGFINASWETGVPLRYTHVNSNLDSYGYKLVVTDLSGNSEEFFTGVISMQTVLTVFPSNNISIELGSTGHYLKWNPISLRPTVYQIYRNGTIIRNSTWAEHERIQIEVNSTENGIYEYKAVFFDAYGKIVTSRLFATIRDTISPWVLNVPGKQIFEYGVKNRFFLLNPQDFKPDNYHIILNEGKADEFLVQTGSWKSGQAINYSFADLFPGTYIVNVYIFDTSNNVLHLSIEITITDSVRPRFLISPVFLRTIEFRPEGYQLNYTWEIEETFRSHYQLVEFFSGHTSRTNAIRFEPGQTTLSILINVTDFGAHGFVLYVSDTSNNVQHQTHVIDVIDTTPPKLSDSPDYFYQYGTTGNTISWVLNETNPEKYTVSLNGLIFRIRELKPTKTLTLSIDGYSIGTYKLNLTIFDKAGQIASDTLQITVGDRENPVIYVKPADYFYELGSTGNTLLWIANDAFPDNYTIYHNGAILKQDSWERFENIIINIDGLQTGVHSFEIRFYDEFNGLASHTVFIAVGDTIAPAIVPVNDLQVEFNSTGNYFSWEYVEDNPYNFSVSKNGVIQDSGLIQTVEPITVHLDGLPIREDSYLYTLKLWDKSGNTANHSVQVDVADTTPPELISKPSGFSYKLDDALAFDLNWTATDLNADLYTIRRNGELLEQTRWISNQAIHYQINASLIAGKYTYLISVYDKYGNIATHEVRTQITDDLAPLLVFLPDRYNYEYGSTGHNLVWTAIDLEPATYNITKNGNSILINESWYSETNISYIIDGNDVGTYLYEIRIADNSGNLVTDNVTVEVVDTTKPTYGQPIDLQYETGRKGNLLNWSVFDHHPDIYKITRDGIEVSANSWLNAQRAITLQVDDLELGNHIFEIEISDYYGNVAYDTVIVTVQDTRPPELLIYNNVTYEYGTHGNLIDWIGIDWYPDRYEVYSNEKLRLSETWVSNIKIQTNVDGLSIGTYNYRIKLYDKTGNQVNKSIIVTVEDKTAPIIQSPDDFIVELGSTVQTRLWNLSDLEPDVYNLTINGILVDSKSWVPEQPVYLNVLNTTTIGLYLYLLTVSDKSGNVAQSQVLVRTVDTTAPIIRFLSSTQTSIMLEYGIQDYRANWSITDISGMGAYTILVNGEIFELQNFWNSWQNVSYILSNLVNGDYNLTLVAVDTSQNLASNSILITARDTIAPALSHNPGQILELGKQNANLTWVAFDLAPSFYLIYKNSELLRNATWQSGENFTITLDTSTLSSSIYKISVVDKSGNAQHGFVQVQIVDGVAPTITFEARNLQDSLLSHQVGTTNSSIAWAATDEHPLNFVLLRNNTEIVKGVWENNQKIGFILDTLPLGTYLFEIEFFDLSNNNASHVVLITIVDKRAPELSMPDDLSIELVQDQQINYTIEWTVYDFHPKNYTILLDQNIIQTGEYGQSDVITIKQPIERLGKFETKIIIQDEFNQTSTDIVQVFVQESNPPLLLLAAENVTIEFGAFPTERIQWKVFDKNPTTLNVYFEGELFGSGNWISNKTESIGFPNLKVGSYNITLQFFDIAGVSISTAAWWNVVDTTKPRISHHPELHIEYGTREFITYWQAFDLAPDFYQILYDGKIVDEDYWDNDDFIIFEIPRYLPIKTYNYIIIIYDASGNRQADSLRIQVADKTVPTIIAESEIVTSSSVKNIEWRISDLQLDGYKLYINGSMIESGDFAETHIVMFTRISELLAESTYVYTITVHDKSGNSNTHDVQVIVKDTEAPKFIDYPNEGNAFLGQNFGEKQVLTFSSFDSQPGLYYVTRGSKQIVAGENWENFEVIEVPVKNLQNFNNDFYNITVVDRLGFKTSFTVEVGLIDTINPQITIISEDQNQLAFEYGKINTINWTAFDRFPGAYFLTIKERDSPLNPTVNPRQLLTEYLALLETDQISAYRTKFRETFGTILTINDWFALQNIGTSLNLEIGYYVVSLIYFDRSDNFEIQQISITVQDTIAPVITETYDAQVLEFDLLLEDRVSWELVDLAPSKYEIWNGEVLLHNGTWEHRQQRVVLENLTMFIPGITYNLTVKAYDKHGFTSRKQSFITFQDTLEPRINRIFNETKFTLADEERLLGWTLQDQHLSSYSIYIDQELTKNESLEPVNKTVFLSLARLNFGTYNIRIVAKDSFGNLNFDSISIFINDETAPVIYAQKMLSFEYGTTVENNTWYAFDFNPSSYQIKLNNRLLESGNWSMNEPLELPLKQLPIGTHQLELVVFDRANNMRTEIISVQVLEKTVTTTLQQRFYTVINLLFLVLIIVLSIVGIILYVDHRRRRKSKNLK